MKYITAIQTAILGGLGISALCSPSAKSQTQHVAADADLQAPKLGEIRVLYTGKLMGHFRTPDLQGLRPGDCPDAASRSVAVDDFEATLFNKIRLADIKMPVLVGTGDNFAPELEARDFCVPESYTGDKQHVGKELFEWDGTKWVRNEDIDKPKNRTLRLSLQQGLGEIPMDNAAQFFIREGYAALVPGKHDFYFGPQRLREIARYLAATPIESSGTKHGAAVQMLGANLVIETTWKTDHKPVVDVESPPWFVPRFPDIPDLLRGTKQSALKQEALMETSLRLSGLSDHASVYPWFQGPEVQVVGADPNGAVASSLKHASVFLCPSLKPGQPNALADPHKPSTDKDSSCSQVSVEPDEQGDGSKFRLRLPNANAQSLIPNENYGLCIDLPQTSKDEITDSHGTAVFCLRFSVYTPFFQFPWVGPPYTSREISSETSRQAEPCNRKGNVRKTVTAPDLYALVESVDEAGVCNSVAIFGIVDPHLTDYVGTLNLSWENTFGRKYKSQAAAKDPVEALKQMLDYFDAQHPELKKDIEIDDKTYKIKRRVIKVLLAQMSPQTAQVLAARLGKFQVVISAADQDLAAVDDILTTEWSAKGKGGRQFPMLVASPEPYYVANRVGDKTSPWLVDIGSLSLHLSDVPDDAWRIATQHIESDFKPRETVSPPSRFWIRVKDYLNEECLENVPHKYVKQEFSIPIAGSNTQQQQIQWLAACVAQKKLGADVVLLQKRDFFLDLPYSAEKKADTYQQFIDRLIWKGDFLMLMYVPGSVLQTVMKQSKAFDADDASQLSVADEKNRGFYALGIRYDAAHDEYLINEVPLDKNRIYAVATSDFVGLGDTGYPDLATGAIRQITAPKDFDSRLNRISSLVCRKLVGSTVADKECLGPLLRDVYFDEIAADPSDVKPVDSAWHRFWSWSVLRPSKDVPGVSDLKRVPTQADRIEQSVEQRGLASFRINQQNGTLFTLDSSLNLNLTNHKFSDAAVNQVFVGNPVPQLSSKRSHTIGYDFQPTLKYSWHKYQLFWATEERYAIQYTGQANAPRVVNQKENLLSSDIGFAFDIPDRSFWHFEAVETFHYETQIEHPTLDTLVPLPKGSSIQQPADTSRTHYLLPRVGLRFVNRTSWIEAGLEDGTQLKAARLIPAPPAPPNTLFQMQRQDIPVSGSYWRWHLVVPFASTISWTVDEQGDFFFNQHGDSQTDTRFRSDAKTQLNFQVFPSLSFAPTYEFFYFANKVREDWYWQGQASIQMNVRFDFWNRRRVLDQLKYKIPSQ